MLAALLTVSAALAAPNQGPPKGISQSDWSSIRAAHEGWQRRVQITPTGVRAAHPGQQWITDFDGVGFLVRPKGNAWEWGLALEGARHTAARASDNSVRFQRGTLQGMPVEEWFVNQPSGLEQGFTIAQRPQTAKLALTLNVRGTLSARGAGQAIQFVNAAGATVIDYAGLKAWDATGRQLTARMEGLGSRVRIEVDDRNATYPVTIDPVAQQAYVKASNTDAGDNFGTAVAISGDTAVVSAVGESSAATGVNGNQMDNSATDAGAVYVFVRNAGVWSQQAYLKASNAESNDFFGVSVSISGDTIVVGAHQEASAAAGVNGNQADNSAPAAGAAYVFTRSGTVWSQQAYLKASNPEANDQFGISVGISGDTIVVGANTEDSSATGVNGSQANGTVAYLSSGAAYVFKRTGTSWAQQAYLKASNTLGGAFFGGAVAISGNTIIVGATGDLSGGTGVNGSQLPSLNIDSGAAYVFTFDGTNWSQQAFIKASNRAASDHFGQAVAIDVDTAVVSATGEDSNATGINGSQSNNSASSSGAVYVFVRSGTTWSQQAYVKASNTDASDIFGSSISISGDTLVVGAPAEASNATGVNGNQADNSAATAGAAYVFTRSGTTWSQLAYLKASNTDSGDFFGKSVAVAGSTVVVGAFVEGSAATGIGGNQADNSAAEAGAAYIFDLNANGGAGGPALSVTKSFNPPTILAGGTSTLTITLINSSASPLAGVTFTDTFPANLVIANPNGFATTCTSTTNTATPNTGSFIFSGTVPASGSCTASVSVTSTTPAVYPNSVTANYSTQSATSNQAVLTVNPAVQPLTFTKSFFVSAITVGGNTTLTFTVTNPNSTPANFGFTDNLPAGVVYDNQADNQCGGTPSYSATSVSLASATIAGNSSCTLTVKVKGASAGSWLNTATGSGALAGINPTAPILVVAPPTITKSFSATDMLVGNNVVVTITITNPNVGTALTGLSVADNLPSGMVLVSPIPASNTCGGSVLGIPGTSVASLLSGNLAAAANCTFTLTVTAVTPGQKTNNTTPVVALAAGLPVLGGFASASINVVGPAITTKSFSPASIEISNYSKLSIVVENLNTYPMTNVNFTDAMPSSLIIVTPTDVTSSGCGAGAVVANAGTSLVSLTGGSIVSGVPCIITVTVQGTAPGSQVNTTSIVTSTVNGLSLPGKPATATLQVGPSQLSFFVRYAANLAIGDSVVNMTNTGQYSSVPGIPVAQNGNICANVYTYSPDEQLVSCCSCLVTPNALASLSVNGDLTSNALTPIRPSAAVIKMVASAPGTGTAAQSCNPATVTRGGTANFLVPGLAAWGSTLHALPVTAGTPAGTYGTTETPFALGTYSDAELARMTQLCAFVQANGSGYGICKSCKVGGLGAAAK